MEWFSLRRRRSCIRAAFFVIQAIRAAQLGAFQNEDEVAALSRQVKALMSQGKFEQAVPLCERLVKAVPGNIGLILNLGLAEQMSGHPDKAIPQFESVLKTDPNNAAALNSLASSELQLDQPKAAVAPLKKLVGLQSSNLEVRRMLASALLGAGELDPAAVQYLKLTSDDPSDPKAWYGLGKTHQEQSARLNDRLVKKDSHSGYVAALIGASRLQSQQFHSAFFFFKEAERSLPSLRGVHSALAVIYGKAGHADWVAIEEKKEDSLPPPDCTTGSPECLFVQNRYAAAARAGASPAADDAAVYWGIKAYNQLALEAFARLEALPESVESHAVRAQTAHVRNQEMEAVSEWRAALKLAPGNSRLEGELMTSLFLVRDYSGAIPMIEKQLQSDKGSADLNFMMGESLLRTEQPDAAVPYLNAALKINANMLPADASLGLALAKLNRDSDAIPHLKRALELDDDGALHYQLAQAYQKGGDAAQATTLMAQYEEIKKRNQQEKEEVANDLQIIGPYRQ
jgi:tetratricopeptide (TPR) repeat protein